MKALVRSAFSGSRKRYHDQEYDLDLTYITPRLIAMGFPASGIEKTFRNDISDVKRFLDARHRDHYYVFNLSHRLYERSVFHNRSATYGFPDHHPPPLDLLCRIVNHMYTYLQQHPANICVVHCLAGKGRTGVIISCMMLYNGDYGSLKDIKTASDIDNLTKRVIEDFKKKRGQGVSFPSQVRYINYFIQLLKAIEDAPISKPLPIPQVLKKKILNTITLKGIPNFDATPNGGCTPILQVIAAPSEVNRQLFIYNTAWEHDVFHTYNPEKHTEIIFDINKEISGDILVRCFHGTTNAILGLHTMQMFHLTFCVDYLHLQPNGTYIFPKEELDDAASCPRFSNNFAVHFKFAAKSNAQNRHSFTGCMSAVPPPLSAKNLSSSTLFSQSDRSQTPGGNMLTRLGNTIEEQKMGWLVKQGGFMKTWKKRWFVLRGSHVAYFRKMADHSPIGIISLLNVHLETCNCIEVKGPITNYHYFKIIPKDETMRTYILGARTEKEMASWINPLSRQATLLSLDFQESNERRKRRDRKPTVEVLVQRELSVLAPSESIPYYANKDSSDGRSSSSGDNLTTSSFYTIDELMEMEKIRKKIAQGYGTIPDFATFKTLVRNAMDDAIAILAQLILNQHSALEDAFEDNPYGLLHIIAESSLKEKK